MSCGSHRQANEYKQATGASQGDADGRRFAPPLLANALERPAHVSLDIMSKVTYFTP